MFLLNFLMSAVSNSCKKLVPATKQMSVHQAPNILVVQLKVTFYLNFSLRTSLANFVFFVLTMVFVGFSSQRFEGEFGGKIDKPIALEEFLELSSYMCEKSKDPRPEYKLFGTVVHAGLTLDIIMRILRFVQALLRQWRG